MEPIDRQNRAELDLAHIRNSVRRDWNCRPYFRICEREPGNPVPYRVRWRGNAVTAMSGPGRWMALYPEL